jgi:hypothetical protein
MEIFIPASGMAGEDMRVDNLSELATEGQK